MEAKQAYIFQGNSLVVPADTPDSGIQEEIDGELIYAAFGGIFENRDDFITHSLDRSGDIRAIVLPEGELPAGWKAVPVRHALTLITGGSMAAGSGPLGRIIRTYHLSQWRKDSRFCGTCGAANADCDKGEFARECPACGRLEFPRISPAVITVITNDKDEILLAHNKNFTSGFYSLIAGFNEAGESLESSVAREIQEEVSLTVKDIRYIISQPWPFPNSLMLGFAARHSGGEIKPDGNEIEDARWFTREALPALPGSLSVSRYLIDLWINRKL